MNHENLEEYVTLTIQKRSLNSEIDTLQTRLDELEPELLDAFLHDGVQSVALKGLGVAYMSTTTWAGAVDGEDGRGDYDRTCNALERAGLEMFVNRRFNVQTLSAYVRNQPRDPETGRPVLPPELEGEIKVSDVTKISVRRAG